MNAADVGSHEIRDTGRFRERAAGVPNLSERRAAERQEVHCSCGHVGTLLDVQWWGAAGQFHGSCRSCHTSLCFDLAR